MITRNDSEYQAALQFLFSRLNYERTDSIAYDRGHFRLGRMRCLLEELDNPHRRIPTIHIAGTKGKGSTSHFISSILQQAGCRAGCYTSPHLVHIEERFAIDGKACSPQELIQLVDRVRPAVRRLDQLAQENSGPTFFEITTAMAMVHFLQSRCQAMVLEVGLGGRLDSTNVCQPMVTLITSISFDHMRQLGDSLPQIAREKAGIIKPGVPVITGVEEREPFEVISQIAHENEAPLRRLGHDFGFHYHPPRFDFAEPPWMDYWSVDSERNDPWTARTTLGAIGHHQAANASMAWATAETLRLNGFDISDTAICAGIATGRCPGRVEVIADKPPLIVDTAHNGASIRALVRVLQESFPQRPRTLILAATRGKAIEEMLSLLVPEFETIICTQYTRNPRALNVLDLYRLTEQSIGNCDCCPRLLQASSPAAALANAKGQTDTQLICATGSFFLAAEVKDVLRR